MISSVRPVQSAVSRIRSAYIEGRSKQVVEPTSEERERLGEFQRLLTVAIDTRFSAGDALLIRLCRLSCRNALAAGRAGDITAADNMIAEAHALFRDGTLSEEGQMLCEIFYEPALAYIDYLHNDYEGAVARVHKALLIDEALEAIPAYAILHLHRTQLVQNLIRTYGRSNRIREAVELSLETLNYLEGKPHAIPAPTRWDSSKPGNGPRDLVALDFDGITTELAFLLAEHPAAQVRDLFASTSAHTSPEEAASCYLCPQAHSWLKVKQALVNEDMPGFLEYAASFLADGRGASPWLWYATIVDLLALSTQRDLPELQLVRQEVVQDAPGWAWEQFPSAWKRLLERSLLSAKTD